MIELELTDRDLWSDTEGLHVIIHQDWTTYEGLGPGWFVRDENRELGPYAELAHAFTASELIWGEVSLAPANRLRDEIENGDECDAGNYLLEYLATYGTAGIDAQALAARVFARIEES